MAAYYNETNEKLSPKIIFNTCFEALAAKGICTAEQLRKQPECYQEALNAVYGYALEILNSPKYWEKFAASGLQAEDVAGSFLLECMKKDSKLNALLQCRDYGYTGRVMCYLANHLKDLGKHGTRKTKEGSDAERVCAREKVVSAVDDETLQLLSAETEAAPVGCEQLEELLAEVKFSQMEKLMVLFLDNNLRELMAVYNSAQSVEAFVHELVYEGEMLYGVDLRSDAEGMICALKKSLKELKNIEKTLLLARHRARKKARVFAAQKKLCRSLDKAS